MIHLWAGNSLSTASNSDIGIRVNYNSACTSDDYFFVTAFEDASGNVLWSNYILLIKDGASFPDNDAQV